VVLHITTTVPDVPTPLSPVSEHPVLGYGIRRRCQVIRGHLKDHVRLVDPLPMRRLVVGGLGIAALAWGLGSSDWRGYWSEFWTTARAQIGATDVVTGDQSSMRVASVISERHPASLP
jgi:hypothetical protein